ncbi:MAG: hypothetical protein LQ349_001483 [Xanthoria aureola]|nr:MAG: hypothetical protein LQ349_001483 [Xanthoria aureola]
MLLTLALAHIASAIDTPPNPRIFLDDLYEELPLNLTAGPGEPTCSSRMYGGNLKPASCKNAWDKIERSSVPRRSGVHSAPDRQSFDYLLPQRYLSDDGLCAIDVAIPQAQIAAGRRWDVATGLQLSNSARAVLESCVTDGRGGVVGSFSTRNALIITIREYEPSVDCEPRAPQVPDYDSCELALQAVPASRFVRAFVSSGYREPDRGVTKLPKEYADTSGRCESASVVFARPDCPHIIAAIQGGWVVR